MFNVQRLLERVPPTRRTGALGGPFKSPPTLVVTDEATRGEFIDRLQDVPNALAELEARVPLEEAFAG